MLALLSTTFEITNCDFEDMTDIKEKIEDGELVTNCDQMVVVDNIESLIKVIRGQQVMLDKDIAMLYGVETRTLNQAVKRNPTHFNDGKRNMNAGKTRLQSTAVYGRTIFWKGTK